MHKYRKLLILIVLVAFAGIGGYVYLEYQSPPQIARILPDGDRLLYANLRPLHLLDWNQTIPVQMEEDYREFVDQSGIHFERDLDRVAVSWHDTPSTSDTGSASVFEGRFDPTKLNDYLKKISAQTESYRNRTIFLVPHDSRIVRVCLLDSQTVAVTNTLQADTMHGMIDRWPNGSGRSTLLAAYYKDIPAGSLGWVIARFAPDAGAPQLPDGLSFSFLENKVAVVSARYNGSLLLRADLVAASEEDAKKLADSAAGFLAVYRGASATFARAGDADVKSALDSIQVEQRGNKAVFSASLSKNLLKKIAAENR